MAELILAMGNSGTGKSTSLRNLDPEKTIVITPNGKSLPFPGGGTKYVRGENMFVSNALGKIQKTLTSISANRPNVTTVVLEDFTHFFSAHIFNPSFLARNSGGEAFQRWNEFGAAVYAALFQKAQEWRDDLDIIIVHHTEVKEDGMVGFKSAGKLLDNTIDFPSYFTYIFHSVAIQSDKGVEYKFQTNVDGGRHAKTPYGVFTDLYVPNDVQAILDQIKAYKKGEIEITFK